MKGRRVVVTGLGVVSSVGHTVAETWAAWLQKITLLHKFSKLFPGAATAQHVYFSPLVYARSSPLLHAR